MTNRNEPLRLVMYLFLGAGVLASVYPLYWMLTASTLSEPEIFRSPPRLLPGGQFSANLGGLLDAMPVVRMRAVGSSLRMSGTIVFTSVTYSSNEPRQNIWMFASFHIS